MEEASEKKVKKTSKKTNDGSEKHRRWNHLVKKWGKRWLIILIVGICGFVIGLICLLVGFLAFKKDSVAYEFPEFKKEESEDVDYSLLTGLPLKDKDTKNSPLFCMQTPNGTDGARPQSGLTEAGVVFEAIAEAGITRFAAIYQNPTSSVIGPIRSLRMYYLEWDTPFDCTIVHAGGAADALKAVSAGNYRNMDESTAYMYRGTYGARRWNNLFTTPSELKQFNSDHGFNSSEPKTFARMTPEESNRVRLQNLAGEKLNIVEPAEGDTSKVDVKVPKISISFASAPSFNVEYSYNSKTNSYDRGYQNGVDHEVYKCKDEKLEGRNPEDVCELTVLSPSVVIAMMVNERRAADGYHENITTIGNGDAYIFQNGTVVEGSWSKATREDQIKFFDEKGEELKLAPGQTFISAVPNYGNVEY